MYYDADKRDHDLARDPFKALVAPRPIGWISSLSASGVCNLAPYSFFNAVCARPAYVMFASEGAKDSLRNIHETGEFVCSLATWELRDHMNITSAAVPNAVDEFPLASLEGAASHAVRPPRVKRSPAAFECRHWKTVEIPADEDSSETVCHVVFGRVVGVYIDDAFIKDGLVDTGAMRPIARLGYMDYAVVTPQTLFTINRPEVDDSGAVTSTSASEWDGVYR